MKTLFLATVLFVGFASISANGADEALPVREVTVFKDGHAFVMREGALAADRNGEVTLSELPEPVVGTFWAYATNGQLRGVTATRRLANEKLDALSLRDLIKANVGAQVTVIEGYERQFDATILGVPQAPPDETLAPTESESERSRRLRNLTGDEIVLLQTDEGVRVRALNSISQIVFKNAPRLTMETPQFQSALRLQMDVAPAPGQKVGVGLAYLQKGLRWIPSYRLSLDKGKPARLQMQATLANDLIDLKGAAVNLVIGVPSFAFKDTIDPIALRNDFTKLGPLFNPGTRSANLFSNAIATQRVNNNYNVGVGVGGVNGGAETSASPTLGAEGNEDFFVYSVPKLTLAKGERTTFALTSSTLKTADIYAFESAAAPPAEIYRGLSYEQQRGISAQLAAPKVMHRVRIFNETRAPLTTAPTLIESNGRLLAQTLMTYTAIGGRSDIDLAPAVDVTVKREETEIKRTPNALKFRGDDYTRVDVAGTIKVTSYRAEPITLELSQQVVGATDSAGLSGKTRQLGMGDDALNGENARPSWWSSNNGDWRAVNGLSAINWELKVGAKAVVEVPYAYHYFWR